MLGCISSDLAVQVSQVFAPGALFLLVTHLLGDVPAFLLILLALKSLGYLRLQVFYEFPHVLLEVIPATSREADSLGAMGEVEVGHVYPVRGRRLLCSLSNKKLADGAGFPGARGTKGVYVVSNRVYLYAEPHGGDSSILSDHLCQFWSFRRAVRRRDRLCWIQHIRPWSHGHRESQHHQPISCYSGCREAYAPGLGIRDQLQPPPSPQGYLPPCWSRE